MNRSLHALSLSTDTLMRLGWVLVALGALAGSLAAQDLVVDGGVVHTVSGEPIEDGRVVILDGKIRVVGKREQVPAPEGVRRLAAAVVTPGLVDAHGTVGLAGLRNQDEDNDELDGTGPVQPELRAVDAYDARDPIVRWLLEFGITTVHTGHAPGAVISGQTLVVKTVGGSVGDGLLRETAMIAATLGDGANDGGAADSPGTRGRAAALLRQALADARHWAAQDDAEPNLRHEALARVLARELPLLVTAHRHHDILTALRIAEEFDVALVLDGAAEAYLVLDEIADAGVPVVIHPAMTRSGGMTSPTANVSFTTAARLHAAGIPFAQQSGYESYVPRVRVALLEAAISVRYGLPWDAALRSITLDAAELIGVADRVGSLDYGKDGDLALYDGDPFEYTTHCIGVVVDGEVVSDTVR